MCVCTKPGPRQMPTNEKREKLEKDGMNKGVPGVTGIDCQMALVCNDFLKNLSNILKGSEGIIWQDAERFCQVGQEPCTW